MLANQKYDRDVSFTPDDDLKQHHVANLDMTHCGLQIPSDIFGYFFVVHKLDLKHNKVELFSPRRFPYYLDNRPVIRPVIDLRNNPLVCGCKMRWLKENVQNQTHSNALINADYIVTYCSETLWLKSELITSLPGDMFLCTRSCPSVLPMECKKITCYTNDYQEFDVVKCSGYLSGLSPALDVIKSQICIAGGHIPTLELTPGSTSKLKYLNVTACHIVELSSTTFAYTPHLQSLVLAFNLISTVSGSTLYPLYKLRYLDFSNNLLQAIEANTFLQLGSLETLLLHSNKLTDLNKETLNVLHRGRFKNISLYGNPWECSCNSSFKLWIVEHERMLTYPRKIHCDESGVPVMLSNISCTQNVYVSTRLSRTHVVIFSVSAILLAGILTACTILCNKYSFELSVLVFTYMPNCFKYHDDEARQCGIFAIYEDKAYVAFMWVKDDLISHVEPACPLICLDRDFLPGTDMMDNIEDAIKRTNCAVVLLTENFLQNHWSVAVSRCFHYND